MADPATAFMVINAVVGAASKQQEIDLKRNAERIQREEAAQRETDFRRRTAPIESFYQGILEPGFQAVDPTLQANLSGQVRTQVEDAVQRAQERVRADAIRRGIFRSGVTGESLRDVEERGLEQIRLAETDIGQRAAALTQQAQQNASSGLAALSQMQAPGASLASLEAQFAQQAAQPWQQFSNFLLAEPASALEKWYADRFKKPGTAQPITQTTGSSFGVSRPVQSAFQLPGVRPF